MLWEDIWNWFKECYLEISAIWGSAVRGLGVILWGFTFWIIIPFCFNWNIEVLRRIRIWAFIVVFWRHFDGRKRRKKSVKLSQQCTNYGSHQNHEMILTHSVTFDDSKLFSKALINLTFLTCAGKLTAYHTCAQYLISQNIWHCFNLVGIRV